MLPAVEQKRLHLSKSTEAGKKSLFGQFLTPRKTASFMTSLFTDNAEACHLLDAGAGIGSLSAAFLDRWKEGGFHFKQVTVDAFELDSTLIEHLAHTLQEYNQCDNFSANIHEKDFIRAAVESLTNDLFSNPLGHYTHAILNPPYKKINSHSTHRLTLRRAGIETVNLYSAFVALAIAASAPGGQIVAILPRSFCNGPYYRSFRDFIFEHTAIRHIHLFESRRSAFKDDNVLQENIIIHMERGRRQESVTISTSTDDNFSDLASHEYSFERIVYPGDPERFLHVPTSPEKNVIEQSPATQHTLTDIGIKVSTGPIVDFRLKVHLRDMPETGTAPLLYPSHFSDKCITWPIENMKKPNAIEHNAETEKWLYPTGFYCVVRRFSSKEESRRIVANVVDPEKFSNASALGFENHLNVFHENKGGLPASLAHGLTVFLNATMVDKFFRLFNGHTQVNATDLRLMRYPSRDALIQLGEWAMRQETLTQDQIDTKLRVLIA